MKGLLRVEHNGDAACTNNKVPVNAGTFTVCKDGTVKRFIKEPKKYIRF